MPPASSIGLTCRDALAIFSEQETLRLQAENTRLEAELRTVTTRLHALLHAPATAPATTPGSIDPASVTGVFARQRAAPATWQQMLFSF